MLEAVQENFLSLRVSLSQRVQVSYDYSIVEMTVALYTFGLAEVFSLPLSRIAAGVERQSLFDSAAFNPDVTFFES